MHNIFEIKHTSSSDRNLELCHHFMGSWFAVLYFVSTIFYFLAVTPHLPGMFTMPWGGFVFCIGPGFALYSFLSIRRESHFSYLTLLILSCSLGFSFNFLTNIVIYLTQPSLIVATNAFLIFVSLLYALLLYIWRKRGAKLFVSPESYNYMKVLFAVILAVVFTIVLFYKKPPAYYIEELMVLRKLFENSHIMATNLAFHPGIATTYYFVPFFQFIGMSAIFSGVDIFRAIHGLWPFTSAVSLLCIVGILRLMNGYSIAIAVAIAVFVFHTLFLPQPASNLFTLFAPSPDRYSLPNGVLIPLAFFHFLIHMGEKKINIAAFIGLVYLITEITFVHARETIHFIGIVFCVMFVLLFDFKRNKYALVRIFWLLCILGAILLIYRKMNLTLQPELLGYVSQLKLDMIVNLMHVWNNHGFWGLFGMPQFVWGANYHDHTLSYPERLGIVLNLAGYSFIQIVIFLLPVYTIMVDRAKMLVAPAIIAFFGLFSLFTGVRLLAGIVIGSPFIFDIFSILYLFAFIVFVDMIRIVTVFLSPAAATRRGMFLPLLLIITIVYIITLYMHVHTSKYATSSLRLEIIIYLLTLIAVGFRAKIFSYGRQVNIEEKIQPRGDFLKRFISNSHSLSALFICLSSAPAGKKIIVMAMLIGIVSTGGINISNTHAFKKTVNNSMDMFTRHDQSAYTGQFPLDYNILAGQDFVVSQLNFQLPTALIDYVRTNIPPQQIWFGGDTALIQLISNQYSPIITFCGRLHEGFEANFVFYREFRDLPKTQPLDPVVFEKGRFTDFLENLADVPRLISVLDKHQVQWIITRPDEKERVEILLASESILQKRLRKVFETDGYMIFQMMHSE